MSRSHSQFNNTSSFVSSFACSYVETKGEQKPQQKRSKTVKQGTIYRYPELANGHVLSTGLDLGNHIQSLNHNELQSYYQHSHRRLNEKVSSLGSNNKNIPAMGSSTEVGLMSVNPLHVQSIDQKQLLGGTLSSISHSNGYNPSSGAIVNNS